MLSSFGVKLSKSSLFNGRMAMQSLCSGKSFMTTEAKEEASETEKKIDLAEYKQMEEKLSKAEASVADFKDRYTFILFVKL